MDVHAFIPGDGSVRRLPSVILLPEAFGVNGHVQRVGERIASLGYAAFAPELFHRSGPGVVAGYDEFPRIRPILAELTNERISEDLRVTHRHVIGRPDVDPSKVAAWGFCMGGWAAMLAACELPIAAAISFYGGGMVRARPGIGFRPLLDRMGSIRCPVLLVFGGKDSGIPAEDIGAVQSRLKSLGKRHDIEVYPEAGHGFFCEDRASYHRSSAEEAWTNASAWLASQLE
jgi:carboxymethylenebutenolidase